MAFCALRGQKKTRLGGGRIHGRFCRRTKLRDTQEELDALRGPASAAAGVVGAAVMSAKVPIYS